MWLNAKEVSEIAECNMHKAREIIKIVNTEIEAEGYIIPNKYKAPKDRVLKRLGIEYVR